MSKKTVSTWGYRAVDDEVEAKIFECAKGDDLPAGWVDSPAKLSKPKKRKA